jgi:hypothetical protein
MFGLVQYNFLSHIGFSLLLISYIITNILYLRILLTISSVFLASWSLIVLKGDVGLSVLIWNCLFLIINFIQSIILYKKKLKELKESEIT